MRRSGFVLAVVAAAGLSACTSTTSGKPSVVSGVRVTCASRAGDAQQDKDVLRKRARRLTRQEPSTSGDAARIVVTLPGARLVDINGLCTPGVLDFRPLAAPAGTPTRGGTRLLTGLGFPVPVTDADYGRLTAGQQHQLLNVLPDARCPAALPGGAVVACQATPPQVAVLGPPIVAGEQVQDAVAQPPGASSSQWTVILRLRADGARIWQAYTLAHSLGSTAVVPEPRTCGLTSLPCADFVGFVLDGQLLSLPVNEQAIRIGMPTLIAGNFTRSTATGLAAALSSGRLPVPLTQTAITATK